MSKEILCYEKGGYRMTLAPWQGGQLIRLQKGELDLLHAPDNEDALALKPTHYGLPVLFPPNRIDAGHFETERHFLPLMRSLLAGEFPEVQFVEAGSCRPSFRYYTF